MATYRSFVDALEALSITGVNRQYDQGPPIGAPGVADCPFQYVRYPGADESIVSFGAHGGWPAFRAELVVCVEPVGQNTAWENFDDTVDMMDNMTTALRGATCFVKSKARWNIRQIIDTVAGQPLPEGTTLCFTESGELDWCFLPEDTEIQEHLCRGEGHGFMTCFYPDGRLRLIWLARDEIIDGVPCARFRHFSNNSVSFHENGKLKSCQLSEDYAIGEKTFKKGEVIRFDKNGSLVTGE